MKRYFVLLLFVLLFSCTLDAEASVGDVKIEVAENEFEFSYTKIADYINGEFVLLAPYAGIGVDLNQVKNSKEMMEVVEKLALYDIGNKSRIRTEKQVANIDNLEEGVYLIEGVGDQRYQMPPSVITIPAWEGGELSYHLSIYPKIQEKMEVVETGDSTQITLLIILCIISLLIVLSLSCVFFRTVLQ